MLQMSQTDHFVKYTGCCKGAKCAYGIDGRWDPMGESRCVGSQEVATQLEKENRCEGPAALFRGGDAECQVGKACSAPTIFCTWKKGTHNFLGTPASLCSGVIWFANLLDPSKGWNSVCKPALPQTLRAFVLGMRDSKVERRPLQLEMPLEGSESAEDEDGSMPASTNSEP